MIQVWDAVVIGLGPAGAMTAYRLALHGWRVLGVDRAEFPRDKVCGGCVSYQGVTWLKHGELWHTIRHRALPLRMAEVRAGRVCAVVPLPSGWVISRSDLDAALVQQARAAGAQIWSGCLAYVGECCDGGRMVRLIPTQGAATSVLARVVVLADGLAGTAARELAELKWRSFRPRRFGAGCCLPDGRDWTPGRVYLAYADGEYIGLTRLADGRLQVAGAWRFHAARGVPLSIRAERILRYCGLPIPTGLRQAAWKGTPAFGAVRPTVAPHLLVVGDAAGYLEPFTGQGIALALESGWQLADRLLRHGGWSPALAEDWQRFATGQLARRQFWTRWVSWLLDRPGLAHAALRCLRRSPTLLHWLIEQLHGSAPGDRAKTPSTSPLASARLDPE